jgi:hypothetical protein
MYLLFFTAIYLTGCCMFMPCHPGTWMTGFVTDMNGKPIENATVSLYGSKQITTSKGCFKFALADALPFTFTAEAVGYQPIEVPRKIGYYFISVRLAPLNSNNTSEVIWEKVSNKEYIQDKTCF